MLTTSKANSFFMQNFLQISLHISLFQLVIVSAEENPLDSTINPPYIAMGQCVQADVCIVVRHKKAFYI